MIFTLWREAGLIELGRSLERVGLRYEKLPAAKWHPLTKLAIRDDPEWPIVTWIIARK